MNTSVYETVHHGQHLPAHIFVTSIRSSTYHWHYDYELMVVLKGQVQAFYGPEPATLSAGDVCLFNSKAVHGLRAVGEGGSLCLFAQFPPGLLKPAAGKGLRYHFYLSSAGGGFAPKLPYRHYVWLAANLGLASRGKTPDAPLRATAWLYRLLADLVAGAQHDLRSTPKEVGAGEGDAAQTAAAIGGYIDDNLAEPNLAQSIMRQFGLSEKSLYRLLKSTLGLTVKEMVDSARVERACQLLRGGTLPVGLVAQECGFSGEVTFYRTFKKEMGTTPGEYRQGAAAKPARGEIQGYLGFDENEAEALLRTFAKEAFE